jgi:uncharacterized membrane protein (Fun14 family)
VVTACVPCPGGAAHGGAQTQMVGGVFIGLQGLASTGVIQINWDKLAELFNSAADIDGVCGKHAALFQIS